MTGRLPDDATLRELFHQRTPASVVAAEYDVTPQAVTARWRGMKLRRHLSHRDLIPWRLGAAGDRQTTVTYLRALSAAAQGRPPTARLLSAAAAWARRLHTGQLAVACTPDGALHTVPATTPGAITRELDIPDVGPVTVTLIPDLTPR